MPDRFDHFNRYNAVELAGKITIVLFNDGYAFTKPKFIYPVFRVFKLFIGYGGGGELCLSPLGKSFGKASPSTTDFQDMMMGFNFELINNPVIFGKGCLFQRRVFGFKNPA